MASLGIPLEERQKAYAGYTTDDLMAKYNEARLKGDLPSMFALLDIIKAAPKPLKSPKTTVEDDIIAAAQSQMPQPAPTGMQGALTAMENQNEMAPVMAADGGFMGRGDNDPVEMLSKGGIARFQFGGAGTVAPYSSFSALSFADVERMAMMGDPDAQKELSNRMRANVRPAPVPGPGPSITSARQSRNVRPTSRRLTTSPLRLNQNTLSQRLSSSLRHAPPKSRTPKSESWPSKQSSQNIPSS